MRAFHVTGKRSNPSFTMGEEGTHYLLLALEGIKIFDFKSGDIFMHRKGILNSVYGVLKISQFFN